MNKKLLIKFFVNQFKKNRFYLILLILSSIFCAISEGIGVFLIFPLLMPDQAIQNFADIEILQPIIKNFTNYSPEFKIYVVSLIIISLILIRFIFLLIVNFISVYLPMKIESDMIRQYYEKILSSNYEFINSKKRGFLISNTFEHPAKSSSIIFNGSQVVLNIFLVMIYFLILLLASYKITIIALLIIFSLYFFVRNISAKPLTNYGKIRTVARYRMYDFFTSSIDVIKYLKIRNAQSKMLDIFSSHLREYISVVRKSQFLSTSFSPFFTTASGVLIMLIILVNIKIFGFSDNSENLWVGNLFIFIVCIYRLLNPVMNLNEAFSSIDFNKYGHDQYKKNLLDLKKNQEHSSNKKIRFVKKISFNQVSFKYKDRKGETLKNINVEILKGEMIAVAGKSGAGKTTLVNLLVGLLRPTNGEIKVDNVTLNESVLSNWREKVGLVSQDILLQNDSLINNLTFGLDKFKKKDINKALVEAGCSDFIKDLPDGLNTYIGENGIKLSGGQQQRITLARCILTNPEIIILDEATSNLDVYTEKIVNKNIINLKNKKTLIVIAHRLSTIIEANKIVFLKKGIIKDIDSHKNLIKKNMDYKEMVRGQFLDSN